MGQNQANTADKQLIQLKQKLLHFRSEVIKQERLLIEQNKKLLQQDNIIGSLTDRLEELVQRPTPVMEDVPVVTPPEKTEVLPTGPIIDSYFSYSVMAPIDTNENEPFLIKGHFIIDNKGDQSLHDPIICFTFNKPEFANLSGRIKRSKNVKKASEYSVSRDGVTEAWSFLEEKADHQAKKTGQFWLQPPVNIIPPHSSIAFSDFEILLHLKAGQESLSLSVSGFVYGTELSEGHSALNSITLTLA
ncbi:hypothetical protein [Shouchella patagoniensis]|uniref:hypothetical protein n=1 Tax=Shouchella patagoniensis TaxID=228576 RepID=UPI000994B3B0|nr:hypothetical protein [Shouchella patagoniensis]